MASVPELIFCAGGNLRASSIAINSGFLYGARLPHTVYWKPYFADQDFKNPDRRLYMKALAEHRPHIATVLDLEQPDQYDEVLSWAEEASQYIEKVVIIPKYPGVIGKLPSFINEKQVILGYSVPTNYGATDVPVGEFGDWPVHLLGGAPHYQMLLAEIMNVVSVDNNYILFKALQNNSFWSGYFNGHTRLWVQLNEIGIEDRGKAFFYVAFALSCTNIMRAWKSGDYLFLRKKQYRHWLQALDV